jgi:hypothetical protein
MSTTLRPNMYDLRLPGITIKSLQVPNYDPLAALRYSCVYWASHFNGAYQSDLTDNGIIYQFLQKYFLCWLEALSLVGKVSEGVLTIASLESYLLVSYLLRIYRIILIYIRPVKVPIYKPLSTMRGDSSYSTDLDLNRHPYSYIIRPFSSPLRRVSFGDDSRSIYLLGSK